MNDDIHTVGGEVVVSRELLADTDAYANVDQQIYAILAHNFVCQGSCDSCKASMAAAKEREAQKETLRQSPKGQFARDLLDYAMQLADEYGWGPYDE